MRLSEQTLRLLAQLGDKSAYKAMQLAFQAPASTSYRTSEGRIGVRFQGLQS